MTNERHEAAVFARYRDEKSLQRNLPAGSAIDEELRPGVALCEPVCGERLRDDS